MTATSRDFRACEATQSQSSIATRSEVRDGMRIDWDATIPMDDGIVLRCDVFRPERDGRYAVLLSAGPYAKGLAFQERAPHGWDRLVSKHPEVMAGSSSKYANWEVVDPEQWVPDGYAVLRVDVRGTDPWSARATRDLYECIEWAAAQPWSNGKVGLNGISYFAMDAWQVASLQPPHLAAICAWEGGADFYRDVTHHGGIFCEFLTNWYPRAVIAVQYGIGERGARSRVTGDLVAGPPTLPEETLAKNRSDLVGDAFAHPLADAYHAERSPVWENVTVPMLSAANWGGQGIHPRGNFEGFVRAASRQKWLEAHGDAHWMSFYSRYGLALQKRFFGHFLKGEDTGWERQPTVQLNLRHPGEKFVLRNQTEWPLARTQWTKFYLHPDLILGRGPPGGDAMISYAAMSDGVQFTTAGATGSRNHRPGRGQALYLLLDYRCRPVPGAAGVCARRQRGRVSGRAGPAHTGRPRLAARLASQARSGLDAALSALSHARRAMAIGAGNAGRTRHRDLADMHRGARELPHCACGARQGLRLRGWAGGLPSVK